MIERLHRIYKRHKRNLKRNLARDTSYWRGMLRELGVSPSERDRYVSSFSCPLSNEQYSKFLTCLSNLHLRKVHCKEDIPLEEVRYELNKSLVTQETSFLEDFSFNHF